MPWQETRSVQMAGRGQRERERENWLEGRQEASKLNLHQMHSDSGCLRGWRLGNDSTPPREGSLSCTCDKSGWHIYDAASAAQHAS